MLLTSVCNCRSVYTDREALRHKIEAQTQSRTWTSVSRELQTMSASFLLRDSASISSGKCRLPLFESRIAIHTLERVALALRQPETTARAPGFYAIGSPVAMHYRVESRCEARTQKISNPLPVHPQRSRMSLHAKSDDTHILNAVAYQTKVQERAESSTVSAPKRTVRCDSDWLVASGWVYVGSSPTLTSTASFNWTQHVKAES